MCILCHRTIVGIRFPCVHANAGTVSCSEISHFFGRSFTVRVRGWGIFSGAQTTTPPTFIQLYATLSNSPLYFDYDGKFRKKNRSQKAKRSLHLLLQLSGFFHLLHFLGFSAHPRSGFLGRGNLLLSSITHSAIINKQINNKQCEQMSIAKKRSCKALLRLV